MSLFWSRKIKKRETKRRVDREKLIYEDPLRGGEGVGSINPENIVS
jgi:hypothetical protein